MPYLICEKCGGYYELGDGESFKNFDTCQCGGKLSYVEEDHQRKDYSEEIYQKEYTEIHQKKEEKDKPKFICSNCMKENEKGIFCSKCGGKLIAVKNGRAMSIKNFEESEELEKLSHNASRGNNHNNYQEESKDFLSRINWLGVFVGVGFLLVSLFISVLLFAFSFVSGNPYGLQDYSGFVFTFIIFILLSCLLAIAAGGLAALISKSRDYDNGLINGFLVGIISSVILGIFIGPSIIFLGVICGVLTAFGGAIGIFLRKQMDK